MGLDVYLYKITNHDAMMKWEEEREGIDEDEEAKWIAAHPAPGEKTKIEIDSKVDSKHYFKIGYFRSSYNCSGIDRVLGDAVNVRLSTIFGVGRDDYEFQPDWTKSRDRAVEARETYAAFTETNGGLRVFDVGTHLFSDSAKVTSGQEALIVVTREIRKLKTESSGFGGSYSCRDGDFFLNSKEPLEVVALIPGIRKRSFGGLEPAVYVVSRLESDWYLTALDIVIETIDYVLSQSDPGLYWLHWSG